MGSKDHGAAPLRQLALPMLAVAAGIACINIDVLTHADAGPSGAQRLPRGLEVAAIGLLVAGVMWSVRVHALEEQAGPA